jgi:hypothetical protein
VGARVEQIAVASEHGTTPARMRQHGTVIHRGRRGRGNLRLRVRFDGEDTTPVSIRPHLARVLPAGTGDACR